ncbi:MAG TPA: ATP-binding protein, partial [Flavisolibacter sp.]|nr:ATP-binding protein [Flavisolibacter sp.]
WGREWIKFYNDPYLSIIGGKHPWALGKPASLVWNDIWADISPMLQQVEQGKGTYVESQLLIMERNGYPEETYYTFSYTPVLGDDGEIAGMFCANTDDTDRITGERQLKTLTRLGKRLTDCRNNQEIIENTIATLRENQHDFPFAIFRMVNDNIATLASSTPLGDSAQLVPLEIDLDNTDFPVVQTLKKAITSRKPQVFEGLETRLGQMPKGAWEKAADKVIALPIVQTGSKEPYGVLVVGVNPYRLLDEKYLSFFSLVADQIATSFTDVHAFEEERKRAESLAEIDRAKTTFFSNISHEFRTPLTLMLAPIQDVLSDPNTIAENKIRMEVAHRNLQRLLKLVNTLLEFSRIEAGRMQARFEYVNLSSLTKDLASIFRSAIEKARMELVVDCSENIQAYVDIDMWEKVVLNLLSNAFKYTHSGTITVSLKQVNDRIEFSVTDTGVGIPEAELDKVFERFHRIQNIGGRSQEGTGIGLALVQELVKLHQGDISVRSRVNQGTTFTVSIPNGNAHLPAEQMTRELTDGQLSASADIYLEEALKWLPESKEAHSASVAGAYETRPAKPGTRKRKLLLADDNIDMREYLRRLLSASYEVTAVANGREALLSAQKTKPDLILSDVMMPEMDGFELVKRLKENPATQNIPVILLSARAGEEATIEGLQTGADDYLVKPFSARELLSRIDSNIKIAQSRVMAFTQLYRLFMDAPVAIAILRGAEQRFELANQRYVDLSGKEELIGKTILEA